MRDGLNIPPPGGLDFVSVGALVNRLDPGVVPWRKAQSCLIHVSGGEFNVAANLADCFGMNAGVASAMVDYPIGDMIHERVRAMGVIPFYKRSNEAAAQLKPGDFDWAAMFKNGIRWFHSGGIFAALSETTGEVIIEGMKAAKQAGAVCSFDLNFREKLWNLWGGQEKAAKVIAGIVANADVLVGNEEDLQKGLGITGQDVEKKSKLDASAFFAMIDQVTAKFPQVKIVATTLREVSSTNRHTWGAVAWVGGKTYSSPICELDVLDRVGGGDGFASGFFYGLLSGESTEAALGLGWAHGALLTTTPGDTTMVTLEQVRAFAKGGSARIQR